MELLDRRQVLKRAALAGAGITVAPWWRAVAAVHAPPRGVHLSFTADAAASTTATWFTDGLTDPGTVVQYGPVLPGMSDTDIVLEPLPLQAEGSAVPTPGVAATTHRATMGGLAPGARVRYRVGRDGAWSPVRTFAPAPAGREFTFAHLGDNGQTADSRRTWEFLRARRPDLVLIAGDLSYANGNQPLWDSWFDSIEPVASEVAVMAAPGNHEEEDTGGEAFKNRMSFPGATSYYAFDYANVAFVVSTAGAFLSDGTIIAELAEIERALATAAVRREAGEVDFVAVVQHYPLWTDHESRGPLNPELVLIEEQILQRHQVDMVLVGHDHFYERSVRMAYGHPGDVGYVQVISGGGGKSLYDFVPEEAFQAWSAAHARRYHCVLYSVTRDAVTGRAYATDRPGGELIDEFTVARREPLTLRVQRPLGAAAIAADLDGSVSWVRNSLALCDLE